MGKNRKRVFREEKKSSRAQHLFKKNQKNTVYQALTLSWLEIWDNSPNLSGFQGPWSSGSACSQSKLDGLWQEIRHSKNFGKALWPWTGIIWELQDKTDCTWCTELFSSVI